MRSVKMKALKKLVKESDDITQSILNKTKKFDTHDAALIGLFEDLIGKIISIVILIDNKSFSGIDALIRMSLENYAFIKFILDKNTKNRANSYFYAVKVREIQSYERYTSDEKEGVRFRNFAGVSKEEFQHQFPKYQDQGHIDEIYERYVNCLGLKDKKSKWYNFDGKTSSFEQLCNKIGLGEHYDSIYRMFSSEVHALESLNYFEVTKNQVNVLRKSGDQKGQIDMAIGYLYEASKQILKYYELNTELRKLNAKMGIAMKYR